MLHLIIGGARSGKSTYAESLAANYPSVTYIATAIAFDAAMQDRIEHHRASRPSEWQTIEQWQGFDQTYPSDCILLDCVTLLISNHLLELGDITQLPPEAFQQVEQKIQRELDQLIRLHKDQCVILVSNEVGQGVSPDSKLGNVFRDIAGRINQYLAARAERVVYMVAGLPMVLKEDE